jgi:DNA repair protein RadC
MDKKDLPRERLLRFGVQSLYDVELIALLIHSGTKECDVFELSKKVLERLRDLDDLKRIRLAELLHIKGIKIAKATTIISAIELGRRLSDSKVHPHIKIHNHKDIYMQTFHDIGNEIQEHLIGLYMNTKGYLIHKETIFKGTINQTLIHPREMFHIAIKVSASAVIFVHNHPSGDVSPSQADIHMTEELMKIGQMLHIEVLDHIIISHLKTYSIKHKKEQDIVL